MIKNITIVCLIILNGCFNSVPIEDKNHYDILMYSRSNSSLIVLMKNDVRLDSMEIINRDPVSFDFYSSDLSTKWSCPLLNALDSLGTKYNQIYGFYERSINHIILEENLSFDDVDPILELIKKFNPTLLTSKDEGWVRNISDYYDNVVQIDQSERNMFPFDECEKDRIDIIYSIIQNMDDRNYYLTTSTNYENFEGYNYGLYHKEFLHVYFDTSNQQFRIIIKDLSLRTRSLQFE